VLSAARDALSRGAVHSLLRSRAAIQSIRVLASFRNSWRSKIFLTVWIAAAVWAWLFLARRDVNLVLSVALGVFCVHRIVGSLETGAGRKLQRMLSNRMARLCILVAAGTAFVYASLVAGDWGPVDLIPYAYLGRFHLHHWAWSLVQLVALLSVLRCETPEACRAEARTTLRLGLLLALLALACVLAPAWLPANRSFRLVVALNSVLLGMLSLLLRSRELADRWAGLFTAVTLGTLVGIFSSGATGILRDFVLGTNVPSGLVFFEDATPE